MLFDFVDEVLTLSGRTIVAAHRVRPEAAYLRDHFPTFPVLPGVLMLETMVQAGRRLLASVEPSLSGPEPLVLGGAQAVKYARFVPPGWSLVVEVTAEAADGTASVRLRGRGTAVEGALAGWQSAPAACSGRFTLRAARLFDPAAGGS